MITQEKKEELVEEFGQHENDTGSPEVQIALFTERINNLTEHLKDHPQDHSTRRGLINLVSKRRKLLDYLQDHKIERYRSIIDELGLRK